MFKRSQSVGRLAAFHLTKGFSWLLAGVCISSSLYAADQRPGADTIEQAFHPPLEYKGKLADLKPIIQGQSIESQAWELRRTEIKDAWHEAMGSWPELLKEPTLEVLETTHREDLLQKKVRVPIAPGKFEMGYLLIPKGEGPFPAIFVPFYEPETSIGLGKKPNRDFAYQLAKRGYVTLSIGCPGGDAFKPVLSDGAECQPLSYLAYIAANAWKSLSLQPEVDSKRIGIVGHSFGGKWAMFGACLWEQYACGVWSDAGVIFDESRKNVNYWEPWYLGFESGNKERIGLITEPGLRRGAYKTLREAERDLHELQSLMAPRPFLVSGGSEDGPERWLALNHVKEVYRALKYPDGVAMTNRETHEPNELSNAQIYAFFDRCLKP